MARFTRLLLWVLSATAATCSRPTAPKKSPGAVIPFADWDAGQHSYSLSFIVYNWDVLNHWSNGMHTEPPKIYADILARCSRLGNITSPASRDTSQMLAATRWKKFGVDFIYTDTIDYDDPMQACIQDIENPSIQRGFGDIVTDPTSNGTENDVVSTVKYEAKKSAGSRVKEGLGALGVVAGLLFALA